MNMETIILQIAKDLIELGVIIAVPFLIKTLKSIELKFKSEVGVNNYNYGKNFIVDMYKAHPDAFTEENLVNIIDSLENKFINKLSRETIEHLVDYVIADVNNVVAK